MQINFKTLLFKIVISIILIIIIANIAKVVIDDQIQGKDYVQNGQLAQKAAVIEKKGTTISFVGDILLASNVGLKIDEKGPEYPFEKVSSYLLASDLAVANLESAVAISGAAVQGKEYTFRADPKVLEGLKFSGFDVLSLANNHVLDFGREAFIETLRNIEDKGFNYIGAGKDIDEAYRPVIVEKKGEKIAVFGASRVIPSGSWYAAKNSPGVAGAYNPERLIEEMENIKKDVDYVIVYLHWGTEREELPNKYQKGLAKVLIDNGADLVVGTHPHVLQGFEFYKGKLIAYSLGNFIFTNYNTPTMILNVVLEQKRIVSAQVIPCMIKSYVPEPIIEQQGKEEAYQRLEDISINAKIVDGMIYEHRTLENYEN
ncbi:MAG: CapA family protein [Deltaproteobacteria bacterium]